MFEPYRPGTPPKILYENTESVAGMMIDLYGHDKAISMCTRAIIKLTTDPQEWFGDWYETREVIKFRLDWVWIIEGLGE